MQLYVQDPDLVAIGAGRDEWVKGFEDLKKGYKRDMDQADRIQVDFEDITVSSSGNVCLGIGSHGYGCFWWKIKKLPCSDG